MNKEEVQKYVDETYPDMHLAVNTCRAQLTILEITGRVSFTCCLDQQENVSKIKTRLLESLGHAKGLIEHDIIQIQGGTENESADRHQEL